MTSFQLIAIALGLSADAFAVATAEGILIKKARLRHSFRVAVVFGLCQGIMPLLGWGAGQSLPVPVHRLGDWIACLILSLVGMKMIIDSLQKSPPAGDGGRSAGLKLWILGVTVSLDSFGIGISLGVTGTGVWTPALVIGLVTAVICIAGVQAGGRIGLAAGKKAELAGGAVLILIGLSFLL